MPTLASAWGRAWLQLADVSGVRRASHVTWRQRGRHLPGRKARPSATSAAFGCVGASCGVALPGQVLPEEGGELGLGLPARLVGLPESSPKGRADLVQLAGDF